MKKLAAVVSVFGAVIGIQSAFANGLRVGDTAPCMAMKRLERDGSFVEKCLIEREGATKFMILELFLTSCKPCLENLPIVAKLGLEVATTATTRFVGLDRSEPSILKYVSEHPELASFTVGIDSKRATDVLDFGAVPTIYVLDSTDKIVYSHTGVLSRTEVDAIRRYVQ